MEVYGRLRALVPGQAHTVREKGAMNAWRRVSQGPGAGHINVTNLVTCSLHSQPSQPFSGPLLLLKYQPAATPQPGPANGERPSGTAPTALSCRGAPWGDKEGGSPTSPAGRGRGCSALPRPCPKPPPRARRGSRCERLRGSEGRLGGWGALEAPPGRAGGDGEAGGAPPGWGQAGKG